MYEINWYCIKYTNIDFILFPYCVLFFTPSGKFDLFTQPQFLHVFFSVLYSYTSINFFGRSNTCLISPPSDANSYRFSLQLSHSFIDRFITSSTSFEISKVIPLWPFCPPDFLPVFSLELIIVFFYPFYLLMGVYYYSHYLIFG